jgi:hypothetical protein
MVTWEYKMSLVVFVTAIVSFVSGIYYNSVRQKNADHKKPTFADGVNVNQPLNAEEKIVMDIIQRNNNEFLANITAEEKTTLEEIQEKVQFAINNNPRARINYRSICTTKEQYLLVKKLKRYRKDHLIKDKKHLKSLISKLEQQQVFDLFLGVRCIM